MYDPFCLQATKEAEHRDRLAELRGRGDTSRERAQGEQDAITHARLRRDRAEKYCSFLTPHISVSDSSLPCSLVTR